jgi:hypothetical protein
MTDWKVRIPGRHAIGPVSTELLVRGIKAGRVPLDAEVCEVDGTAWQPLGGVDEFFEAMGLDDAETRLVDALTLTAQDETGHDEDDAATRVVESLRADQDDDEDDLATRLVSAPLLPKADSDGDEDDEATRLVSSLHRPAASVPPPTTGRRSDVGPQHGRGASAPQSYPVPLVRRQPSPSQPSAARKGPGSLAALLGDPSSPRVPPRATQERPPGGSGSADRMARSDRIDRPDVGGPKPPTEAPSERPRAALSVPPGDSPLMDADDDDEESGSLNAKARERFPSIRPLLTPTQLREHRRAGTTRSKGRSWLHHRVDRADELTAPALRLQRAYTRTRRALLLIMAVLIVAVVALVMLLLLR